MPYINAEARKVFDFDVNALVSMIEEPGELNYVITSLVNGYIAACGDVCYNSLNDAIGVLECAKLEMYRRRVAPYEDRKAELNGDVY